MTDLFTPVDTDQIDQDPKATLAKKFGDGTTIDVDKLATAKLEADNFIKQIERENAELRKEVSSKATIDEIMTQIRELAPKPPVSQQQPQAPQTPGSGTPEELETVVTTLLAKRQAEDRARTNRDLVEQKVLEKWGADAQLNLNKKAKELGVSLAYLQQIATDSPSAFFTLTGLNTVAAPAPITPAPRSGFQPPAQADSGKRTKAYYDRLKVTNPTEYLKKSTQQQYYKDAMSMGQAFFDA